MKWKGGDKGCEPCDDVPGRLRQRRLTAMDAFIAWLVCYTFRPQKRREQNYRGHSLQGKRLIDLAHVGSC